MIKTVSTETCCLAVEWVGWLSPDHNRSEARYESEAEEHRSFPRIELTTSRSKRELQLLKASVAPKINLVANKLVLYLGQT